MGSVLPEGLHATPVIDSQTADADLEIFDRLVGQAEIVGLGEATHTNGTFHKTNARIAKYLIEKKGFRTLTLETPHRASLALSKFIQCDPGVDLPFALQRIFPHFASRELSNLYTWVREFNCSHPHDKVSFTGFDVQQVSLYISPEEMNLYLAVPFLEVYLRKNLPSLVSGIPDLKLCGPTAEQYSAPQTNAELQRCLNFIQLIFTSYLNQVPSSDQFEVQAALVSLYQNAQGKRYGPSDFVGSGTWRDLGMAKMISLMRKSNPSSKMIIIGHNTHLFRSPLQNQKNMGSYLDDEFGRRYFVITNLSSELATVPFYSSGVIQPGSNSVESILKSFGHENLLLDIRNNSIATLQQGHEIQADQSTGVITPFVPISKLANVVIYSRTSSAMSLCLGVLYPEN